MYSEFYQLNERPFNVTPDPKFLYLNARYREAIAALQYGITQRKGFITLIGEAGTGKTTLLKRLLDELDQSVRTVFLFNTNVTFEEILEYIFAEFDLPVHAGKKLYMLQRLNAFLLDELSRGRNVALLIDEAQDLDIPVLEDLRLLSNLETSKEKILQIVLSGQPELGQKLSNPALRQLRQRIGINCRLLPLSREEVSEYIQFRLQAAGAPDLKLFTREAEDQIYHFSRGIPRLVNVVCDNALVIGYALGKKRIGADVIQEAAADLLPPEPAETPSVPRTAGPERSPRLSDRPDRGRSSFSWKWAAAALGLFGVAAAGGWFAATYVTSVTSADRESESPIVEVARPAPPAEVIRPGSLPNETTAGADRPGSTAESQTEQRPRLAMLDDAPDKSRALAGEQPAVMAAIQDAPPEAERAPVAQQPSGKLEESADSLRLQGRVAGGETEDSARQGQRDAGSTVEADLLRGAVPEGAGHHGPSEAEEREEPPLDAVAGEAMARERSLPDGSRAMHLAEPPQAASEGQAWEEGSFTRFVVREGDSLSGIARAKYGQASYTILDLIKLANPELTDVDWIFPGQPLRLPNLREGLPIVRSNGGYALLVFSTPNPQRAQNLAKVLRGRGFDARITAASLSNSKKVHRVTVWAGSTQAEAARVGQALQKLLREDARVAQLGE